MRCFVNKSRDFRSKSGDRELFVIVYKIGRSPAKSEPNRSFRVYESMAGGQSTRVPKRGDSGLNLTLAHRSYNYISADRYNELMHSLHKLTVKVSSPLFADSALFTVNNCHFLKINLISWFDISCNYWLFSFHRNFPKNATLHRLSSLHKWWQNAPANAVVAWLVIWCRLSFLARSVAPLSRPA